MHIKQNKVLLLFLLLLPAIAVTAQNADTLKTSVSFGVNETESGNMSALDRTIGQVLGKDSLTVRIDGWSSPEGPSDRNLMLSRQRAESVAEYLKNKVTITDEDIHGNGVDWNGYIDILKKEKIDGWDKLTEIIRNTPEWITDGRGKVTDGKVAKLKRLNGGIPWKQSLEQIFPKLRRADVTFIYAKAKKQESIPVDTIRTITDVDTVAADAPMTSELELTLMPITEYKKEPETVYDFKSQEAVQDKKPAHKPGFLIYTNLLYDAALLPNLGTQFHLGKGWATDVRWGYQWLANDEKHFFYRLYGGELAVRKYFGNAPYEKKVFTGLTGHHLGVYGQVFTYDFEFGNKGQIGGTPKLNIFDNPQYGFGIEYGYTFPLGRSFNLDLSIGAGYAGGMYHEYEPFYDKYMWLTTYKRNWFGPTRIDVTLQWLIGGAKRRAEK